MKPEPIIERRATRRPREGVEPVIVRRFDTENDRRRRDLLDVIREERTPGSKRIHFEAP